MSVQEETKLLPLAEAVEIVTGKKFHPVTVLRWRREGRLSGCCRVGREWLCSIDSVHRMIEKDSVSRSKSIR